MPNQVSVTDTVTMYAVRKKGKNVPYTMPTYFMDEAQSWLVEGSELVLIEIKPYPANNGSK